MLEAGAAQVDITPALSEKVVRLAGYRARNKAPARGVLDRLHVRALFLRQGSDNLIIVSCDQLWISHRIKELVLEAISPPYQVVSRELLICATHTHSGPAGLTDHPLAVELFGPYDTELWEITCHNLIAAINLAARSLRPASLAITAAPWEGYTINRRHPAKPIDPQITLLKIEDNQSHLIALVTNFTAHPTILGPDNLLLSADFPGYFTQELQRLIGGDPVIIFCNGAQGDQAVRQDVLIGEDAYARCSYFGKALAQRVYSMTYEAQTGPLNKLSSFLLEQHLPPATNKLMSFTHAPLQGFIIDNALFLAVPGEVIAALGLQIKQEAQRQGYWPVAIIGLANGYIGYILTEEEYHRGGYEPSVSFYGPKLGHSIEKGLLEVIKALASL